MNIYLDIETRATSNEAIRNRVASKVAPPANYKKADTIAQWWAGEGEAVKQAAIAQTALDGTWGEIVCIGWSVGDGSVFVSTGGTEAETIKEWAKCLSESIPDAHRDRELWIGHNVQDFDLRFLWQRTKVHGIKLPFHLPMERYAKNVFDTMKEWSGFGKYVKQTDLELAFGLTRNDPLGSGAEVATADIASIIAHCTEDVRLVREIHRRMA